MVPLHSNHPAGMDAVDPDHITMIPLGMTVVRLFCTKAVVAICVLLVPLAAVGAVATPPNAEVPLTAKDAKVPKLVTLGWEAVVKVPEMPPETARLSRVPTEVTLGCAAVINVPVIEPVNKDPADSNPVTAKVLCVPISVIKG